jgi:RNA polymerase sigma factor (sigma-70 family)
VTYERLLLEHLGLIDDVVRFVARRHRLSRDETEELAGSIRLKIVENDYDVLRRFEGRSSLRTYITTVVQRHFLDSRAARWGKWRPCAHARRLGPLAVLLDQLLTRDGLTFDEAVQTLRSNKEFTASTEELHALSELLPQRPGRRLTAEEDLRNTPAPVSVEDEAIHSIDGPNQAERIDLALAAALNQLEPEDRLILKMRFEDDFQISRISRLLGLEQKPLYRRLDHVIKVLRRELEIRGVSREHVLSIVGHPAASVGRTLGDSAGDPARSTSPQ